MNKREHDAQELSRLHGLSFYVYQYRGGKPEVCCDGGGYRHATKEEVALWRALTRKPTDGPPKPETGGAR